MLVQFTPATLAVALLCLGSSVTLAQDAPAPASSSTQADFGNGETREEILESPAWQNMVQSFDQWMSVQEIYTESQTAELVKELKQKVASLDPAQLKEFIVTTQQQLDVLMSPEASQARSFLSVATMQYRQKLLARNGMMPNVFGMTVAQLKQELQNFQDQRAATAAASAEFDRSRQQTAAEIRSQNQARQQQQLAARNQSAQLAQQALTRPKSPYVPRPPQQGDPPPRFYVNGWGGITRALP